MISDRTEETIRGIVGVRSGQKSVTPDKAPSLVELQLHSVLLLAIMDALSRRYLTQLAGTRDNSPNLCEYLRNVRIISAGPVA
jgi:hypothetical protein